MTTLFFKVLTLIMLLVPQQSDKGTIILEDFSKNRLEWRAIHDVVMGGLSSGTMELTPDNKGVFSGEVSLDNKGGFASMRAMLPEIDMEGKESISIRVKGDGHTYSLRLRNNEDFDGISYALSFPTIENEWQELTFKISNFEPTFRGRILYNVKRLKAEDIRQVGLLISDKQEGPFRLEIDHISMN